MSKGINTSSIDWETLDGGNVETEDCVSCGSLTTQWWGNGCAPLCVDCSFELTHMEMVEFCKENGYGPIPDYDTTMI